MPLISFVIPVFNEEDNLNELVSQINTSVKDHFDKYDYELIFINDGSTDGSFEKLKQLRQDNKDLKIISFRRNLGKALALNQGFKKAKGDIIVTMDGDLQDGAENLPDLYSKLNEGYDLVVGWKKVRHDPFGKTMPSKVFNSFVSNTSGVKLHDFNSGFKMMTKSVAHDLELYGELHRFIPVLASQMGYKVTEVPVIHHKRVHGSSKYGWERLIRGFFDFITIMFLGTYGQNPLHLFGLLGSFGIFLGLIFGIYLSILHFLGYTIGNRPLLTLSVLLIVAGLQLLLIGLIAEMIVSKTRPLSKLPIDYESD